MGEFKKGSGVFHWCSESGKLIIDQNKFDGNHLQLTIPGSGHHELHLKDGIMEIDSEKPSGKYILAMSNCNRDGRNVDAVGHYVWKSEKGYLPGDMFGELDFFIAISVLYIILFIWYGVSMKRYEGSGIPIQKYIFTTIIMGLAEAFIKSGDYFIWNEDGERYLITMYGGKKEVFLSFYPMPIIFQAFSHSV